MEMTILPLALYMFILSYPVRTCALPVLRLWLGRSSPPPDVTAPSGAHTVGHGCPGCSWVELAPAVRGYSPAKYGRRRGKGLEQGNDGGPRLKMTPTLVPPAGAGGGQIQ
jgi:hypothetical protein